MPQFHHNETVDSKTAAAKIEPTQDADAKQLAAARKAAGDFAKVLSDAYPDRELSVTITGATEGELPQGTAYLTAAVVVMAPEPESPEEPAPDA